MFDLDAGIHLHEVEVVVCIDEELNGAGAVVADGCRSGKGGRAEPLAQVGVNYGRGAFFEQLLVPSLNGALALAEVDDVPVLVAEDLDFDVARLFDGALHVHGVAGKGGTRFAACHLIGFLQFIHCANDPHPAPTAARRGLETQWEADLFRPLTGVV